MITDLQALTALEAMKVVAPRVKEDTLKQLLAVVLSAIGAEERPPFSLDEFHVNDSMGKIAAIATRVKNDAVANGFTDEAAESMGQQAFAAVLMTTSGMAG